MKFGVSTVTGVLLLLSGISADSNKVTDDTCAVGTGNCSAGLDEEGSTGTLNRFFSIMSNSKTAIGSYAGRFTDNGTMQERRTTDEYYDIVTDFFEYGWGSSFHFGTRFKGESLAESILRSEYFVAAKLGLSAHHKVADLGMGIGGPLRRIAKFSGAHITGVTINNYQLRRAHLMTKQRESAQAAKKMQYVHGDYTKLVPTVFAPESLDAAYFIESSCHISNRTEIFSETARALKKGGKLFTYEWVMTHRFDPSNEEHLQIKKDVEYGNGIEKMIVYDVMLEAVKTSGFKIIEHGDLADIAEEWYGDQNVPFYFDIARTWSFESLSAFKLSIFGVKLLSKFLWLVEKIGLVKPGASATEVMLTVGTDALVKGAKLKIITPMYYVVAEKI
eukprot:TRINITY_DN4853_c0_g1_i1.p1 TRINITY_DN4853_c0_g1~~TRINITY_DN4853_c0_g1_i1.p1  ORF type:complete len:389 (+),score=57.90 TRINITY_DN4853_c0_g1_i1:57-1223(+)